MASNRYGIIKHGSYRDCKLKFPSPQARQDFSEKFSEYHASHDHDGDPPTYENVNASVVAPAGLRVHDVDDVTIDGWASYEIEEYHEDTDRRYVSYKPPTCCVAPTLSLGDKTFIPSDAFQRHELSAIFGDMPDPDYKSLLESVQRDGFIENVIKLLDGAILDGWHRYRAAQDLNLLRKLRFQVWNPDEDRDGDPKAFVLARNIERRHLGASQRAQIAVVFNERFGHGGDRSKSSNEPLKTQEELAAQANVSKSSIKRAVQVEKAGLSETVIAGEKAASEVITELTLETLWEQVNAAIPVWKKKREGVGHASRTMFIHATLKFHSLPHDSETNVDVLKKLLHLLSASTTDILEIFVRKQLRGESLWKTDDAAAVENPLEEASTEVDPEKLPLQDAIEKSPSEGVPEETVKVLWEQVSEEMETWKQRHTTHVTNLTHVTKAHLIIAYRYCYGDRNREGEATAEELCGVLESLTQGHMPLILGAEQAWRNSQNSEQIKVDTESAVDKVLLEENRNKAQDACVEMWKAFEKSPLSNHLDKDDFMEVAGKQYQCPTVFPDPMNMKRPEIWVCWFNAMKLSLEKTSEWIQRWLDEFSKENELEDFLRAHWQIHSNWDGLSIDELSEEYNCAPSVIYTVMEKVRKCMSPREDEGDGSSQDTDKVEDDSPKDRDSLLEEWRQARSSVKDLWKNDKEISQTIRYLEHFQERILEYYPPWIRPEVWKPGVDSIRKKKDGVIIAEIKQFKQIVSDIQSRADWVKEMLFPDTDTDALEKFRNQKQELYDRINQTPLVEVKDEFGNVNLDKARHRVMLEAHKAYELSADLLWSDQAIESLSADEIHQITGKYLLMVQDFAEPRADWVAGLYRAEGMSEDAGNDAESSDLAETPISEQKTVADVLGENTLEFITVCLRNPPTAGSAKGKLEHISFDDRDSFAKDPLSFSEIPEALLIQLLEIAVKVKKTE